jgi:carbonic anhydrase
MGAIQPKKTLEKMVNRGVSADTVLTLQGAGVDLHRWLEGFDSVEENVKQSVQMLRQHPLFPPDVPIHGLVICPETGKLDLVVDGYQE